MTGMLWLDDDKTRPFTDKVQRAVDYFKEKHGRLPVACYVHELAQETAVGKVPVKERRTIPMFHFWLIFGDENENTR